MEWINPDTYTKPANGVQTNGAWGGMVHDDLKHLRKMLTTPPMIIAHRGNETVLGPGSPVIALTSALKDTMPAWGHSAGWVAGSANYIFLRRPGWYWVFATVMFASSALDYRMQIVQYPDTVRCIEQPRVYAAETGVSLGCLVRSDGTTRMYLQATGTTSGLTMRAGATLGAVWMAT